MLSCPLQKKILPHEKDNPHRDNPDNREMAFCFQWHDTISSLYGISLIKDNDERESVFKAQLETLRLSLNAYAQKR